MDRTLVSGTSNVGSTPAESTSIIKGHNMEKIMNAPDPIVAYSMFSLLAFYINNSNIPKHEWVNTEYDSRAGSLIGPTEWQNAMSFIRSLNHRLLVLNGRDRNNGKHDLGLYQARFVIEKLPRKQIAEFIKKIEFPKSTPDLQNPEYEEYWTDEFHAAVRTFYKMLDKALDTTDFYKKFTEYKLKKVDVKDVKNEESLAKLFRYPAFIDFTPAATKHLNAQIMNGNLGPRFIDYYFGAGEDYEAVVKLYQPAIHVIKTTHDSHLLWTAGDILNIIWLILPEDDMLNSIFKKQIYNLYWPRIGDIWPIANSSRIKFNSEADQTEFDDSIGWLFSLDNIAEYNPEIAKYIDFLNRFPAIQQADENVPKPIIKRAFWYKYKDGSAESIHSRILDELPEHIAIEMLSYPDTEEEAKLVMDDILSGVISVDKVPEVFESFLMSTKPASVQVFIINYFAENLDKFVKIFEAYNINDAFDRFITSSMFEAACDKSNEQAEYDALYKLAEKIKKLTILEENYPELCDTLKHALEYVAHNVKSRARAQQDLIQLVAY